MNAGNYLGIFVDDVNMEFRVSDGWGNAVQPVDSNTSGLMTYDAWRSYIASFTEQIRAAFPSAILIHNSIWYAGPDGVRDSDPVTSVTLSGQQGIILLANSAGVAN